MPVIRETKTFAKWMTTLRDKRAVTKILMRINRLSNGLAGDVAPVGSGISEMRIHHGPGYRVYFTQRGDTFILLLCGGDKSSQSEDIKLAKQLALEI